jgi:hypothetical protein
MNEDYLWDKSGPPDREIERLEEALGPLRYHLRPAPAAKAPVSKPRLAWALAAAAGLVLAAAATMQVRTPEPVSTGWQVADLEGEAQLGRYKATLAMSVQTGQVLRTNKDAHVRIEAMELGRVDLGPGSELRAESTSRLQLSHGDLHAFIWARPGKFVVDTPSARAVDLGCEYTIHVDPNGNGLLRVTMGWVAFQAGGHESFIPKGAACVTRKKEGPGIPYFEDAPESLREGIASIDRGGLPAILESARQRDGLTLWHVLARVPASNRGAVYDKFASLVVLPPEVTREGMMNLDPKMMDLAWNALELENTDWWRGWERKWSQ